VRDLQLIISGKAITIFEAKQISLSNLTKQKVLTFAGFDPLSKGVFTSAGAAALPTGVTGPTFPFFPDPGDCPDQHIKFDC